MANSFTATESNSGLVITLTDTGTPIAGSVRSFILTDYLGNPITTIPLATGVTTATYNITKPTWINVTLQNTGSQPFQLTQRYGFFRIFQVAYGTALQGNCGCGCDGDRIDFCSVDAFVTGATYAQPVNDSVSWQNDMNAAYALIQP